MMIIYWGTPQFAVPCLEALIELKLVSAIITQPDRPRGHVRSIVEATPVGKCAIAHDMPLLRPQRLDTNFVKELKQYLPAVFLIVAYGKIIPHSVHALSSLPAINLHPSLLPQLRGPSPIQTAILQGLKQTGLSLMQIDDKIDHGPLLAQKKVNIDPHESFKTLTEKLSFTAVQFCRKYIPRYLKGELKAKSQDHQHATFSKIITKDDGLLDFTKSAQENVNKIRAYNPWPGTFFFWHAKRVKIVRATIIPSKSKELFSQDTDGYLVIRCKAYSLLVQQVQIEGKQLMSSVEFLRGHGDILGTTTF